jgi:ParB-like chromosome segregation protein Spo0J
MAKTMHESVSPNAKRETRVILMPPEEIAIREDEDSRKWGKTDLSGMVDSLLQDGQLQEVRISREEGGEDGTSPGPVAYTGRRRIKSLCQINEMLAGGLLDAASVSKLPLEDGKVLVRCYVSDADTSLRRRVALAENLHRLDLTPIDIANTLRAMVDKDGKSQVEASKETGIPPSQVSKYLALTSLPTTIQKRIHAKDIPASAGYRLAALEKKALALVIKTLDDRELPITAKNIEDILTEWGDVAEEKGEAGTAQLVEQAEGASADLAADEAEEGEEEEEAEEEQTSTSAAPKRGRPKGKKKSIPTSKSDTGVQNPSARTKRTLKELVNFFADESTPKEGEDPDVWQELCGYIDQFAAGKMSPLTLRKRGKKACGVD